MVEDAETPQTSVVVGVDGSEHSRRALAWAAREARFRRAQLRIVHALPVGTSRSGHPDPHVEAAARNLVDLTALARRQDARPLIVTNELLDGLPVKALIEMSRRCALLVLGSRGHGGFANLVLGSTAVEVSARAACPVVVVPPGADVQNRSGAVIVGVDASTDCHTALEFAFSRASQRHSRVVALHVTASAPPSDTERDEAESEAMLTSSVARWHQRFPGVAVESRLLRGQAVAELAAASAAEGEVVVVAGRGRSVVAGAFLGSVSQGLLHHSVVPVVITQ